MICNGGMSRSVHIRKIIPRSGPWYDGSPGELRGRKGQTFEGGYRVPLIVRWDCKCARGQTCDALSMNLDLFTSLLRVAGIQPPKDRVVDGRDISPLWFAPTAKHEARELFFYHQGQLEAMRSEQWKYIQSINHYVWPLPVNKKLGGLSVHTSGPLPMLFDLGRDPGESYNLAQRYPERVAQLDASMNRWCDEMARSPLGLVP